MWDYTEKVMDHFLHPRNVGEMPDADAVGEVGNITCGDALKLFLKLDEAKKTIVDAKFQTFGCASAIASASALTELVIGKSVVEVEAISNDDIAGFLGSLPEEKMHCSVMGMEALQEALANLRGESDGKASDHGHAHGHEDYDPNGLDRIVCICFSVSERQIREVVRNNALETVDQVTNYCKAGGSCGGCKEQIDTILKDELGRMEEEDAASTEEGTVSEEKAPLTNLQKMMLIQQVVNDDIRPGLQADGGDLELVDVDGDRVVVKLKGSCSGCPGAQVTLKRWVEAQLREKVLPTITVEQA
ncbi:MAG: Fe-S cluster assembly protein NifU [Lentisphaeria bacterium]|nr:Fe-S cluster assembly protein NifU [Lentisphaeria bacterium]